MQHLHHPIPYTSVVSHPFACASRHSPWHCLLDTKCFCTTKNTNMSWAALVQRAAAAVDTAPAAEEPVAKEKSNRVAVVDTNAIIAGLNLHDVADRFVTTQEVLDECRDKQSRQALASLPFTLEVLQPEDSSIQAVTAFARETGDLHALSRTDLKLLALAHTLEVAQHGTAHLRQHPVQATVKAKHRQGGGRGLPGWGHVSNPQDWAAIDELPDEAGGQTGSRIKTAVQDLTAGDSTPAPTTGVSTASATPASNEGAATTAATATAAAALPFASFGDAAAADLNSIAGATGETAAWFQGRPAGSGAPTTAGTSEDVYQGVSHFTGAAPGIAVLPPPSSIAPGTNSQPVGDRPLQPASSVTDTVTVSVSEQHVSDDEEGEGEEGDWNVAGKSRGAERRRRRKQSRWEARQQLRQQHEAETIPEQHAVDGSPQQGQGTVDQTQQQKEAQEGGDEDGSEQEEGEEVEGEGEGEEEGEGHGEGEGEEVTEETNASATDCGELRINTDSSVCCVTLDFPMQNVLLQMGLRLVTRDGKQINRLSRWALRCSGCFFVTKEAGRLFCPRCGGMTLDRVEVMVGPGGAEFYGVRKKHILRGTRFSLPKPKGGRAANPILREDELMSKMKPRRKKQVASADLDPYAPEHGLDLWQTGQQAADEKQALLHTKGAAYLMASWKHNPNERKPGASNRRRK